MNKFIIFNFFLNSFILSLSFTSMVLFIVSFNEIIESPMNVLDDIQKNWNTNPIKSIRISNDCTESSLFINNKWEGFEPACNCNNKLTKGKCTSSEIYVNKCVDIPNQYSSYKKYDNTNLCLDRDYYSYIENDIYSNGCPNSSPYSCGTVDTLGQKLCVYSYKECPINFMQIKSISDNVIPAGYSSINLSSKVLIYSNSNIGGIIYIQTRISQNTPCISSLYENYSYNPYFLDLYVDRPICLYAPTKELQKTENSYDLLDTTSFSDLLSQNDINLDNYPTYVKPENISLYIRPYIGLKSLCILSLRQKFQGNGKSINNLYKQMSSYQVSQQSIAENQWMVYFAISQFIIILGYFLLNVIFRSICHEKSYKYKALFIVLFVLIGILDFIFVVLISIIAVNSNFTEIPFNYDCFANDYALIIKSILSTITSVRYKIIVADVFSALNLLMLYWEIKSYTKAEFMVEENSLTDLCLNEEELEEMKKRIEFNRDYIRPNTENEYVGTGQNMINRDNGENRDNRDVPGPANINNENLNTNALTESNYNRNNANNRNIINIDNQETDKGKTNKNIDEKFKNITVESNPNKSMSELEYPNVYDYDNQEPPPESFGVSKEDNNSSIKDDIKKEGKDVIVVEALELVDIDVNKFTSSKSQDKNSLFKVKLKNKNINANMNADVDRDKVIADISNNNTGNNKGDSNKGDSDNVNKNNNISKVDNTEANIKAYEELNIKANAKTTVKYNIKANGFINDKSNSNVEANIEANVEPIVEPNVEPNVESYNKDSINDPNSIPIETVVDKQLEVDGDKSRL